MYRSFWGRIPHLLAPLWSLRLWWELWWEYHHWWELWWEYHHWWELWWEYHYWELWWEYHYWELWWEYHHWLVLRSSPMEQNAFVNVDLPNVP